MKTLRKIFPNEIKIGMRYSSPVFFDDSVNMFLATGKTVKKYHIDALKRWSIPFVLTYGQEIISSSESLESIIPVDLEEFDDSGEISDLEPID